MRRIGKGVVILREVDEGVDEGVEARAEVEVAAGAQGDNEAEARVIGGAVIVEQTVLTIAA